jgi:hypothetical protein
MRAHRTDFISLVFALVFGVFVTWWAVAKIVDAKLPAAGWFVAGGLILFGLLGLLGALRSARPEPGPASDPMGPAFDSTGPVFDPTQPALEPTEPSRDPAAAGVEPGIDDDQNETLRRDGDRP